MSEDLRSNEDDEFPTEPLFDPEEALRQFLSVSPASSQTWSSSGLTHASTSATATL